MRGRPCDEPDPADALLHSLFGAGVLLVLWAVLVTVLAAVLGI